MNMQMTCKPTQDLPDVSGVAEGTGRVRNLPDQEGDRDTQVLTPTLQMDPAQPQALRLGVGAGVPEHQPWFCCWLRKNRSLAPRQQE